MKASQQMTLIVHFLCCNLLQNEKLENELVTGFVGRYRRTKRFFRRLIDAVRGRATRKDAHKESVKFVNKLLIKYSKQHHWTLVRHSNITEKVLNRGGLHLTKQGNELLYKNFASCLANNH